MTRIPRLFRPLSLAFALAAAALVARPAQAETSVKLDYQHFTLDNGLEVITLEDFTTPVVNVQVWYHVGSKDENPERQGFAHMFEHMMFRGTDRLGPTDHFDLVRRTGGTCNAYTSFDQTVYHETLPANQLELALWLESERMTFLKIDQNAFDTERKVVEEERRMGVNKPYGTMAEKLLASVFTKHPYRWSPIGNIANLRAASVPELRAFWTKYYVPNNAKLVIVGAVKADKAADLARKYFGWIPRYPDPERITIREPELTDGPKMMTFKEDNAPAPLVGLGALTVPTGHPDDIPLQILATILGQGESSRLYRELVAEKEVAVMAMGGAETLEQSGFIGFAAALAPMVGKPADALAAIDAIVDQARQEPVTEHELEKVRNNMLKDIIGESLSVAGRASALGRAATLEGNVDNVNTRLEQVRKTTAADLLRVAQKYLAPEHMFKGNVEQNMGGALGGMMGFKKKEENPPITAKPETDPPAPGRAGAKRPAGFPTTAPVSEPPTYDPTPKFKTATLANGLKVFVIENHKAPMVWTHLGLLSGAWTETKPGSATMALSMITRGTKDHNYGQLADELETYAISLAGEADLDSAMVSANCLTEQLDRTMTLMAEVVLTPTFPADEYRKLLKQVRTGLVISSNEPGYIADRELRKRLYGQHPYSRSATGEIADLDQLKLEDAKKWWETFARPDLAILIFAGDINLEKAKALAEKSFGGWQATDKAQPALPPAIPAAEPTHIYLVDRPGIQSQIRAGVAENLTRANPVYPKSVVVNGYFGGAFSSRINDTIRVKMGLTYGARGGFDTDRFGGSFMVSTFTKTASTATAVKAIIGEVQRLRDEPPTAEELDKTKSYTLGSFPLNRESPAAPANDVWTIESQGLPKDYLQRLLSGVSKTEAADCTKLVQETIDPAKLTIVVVGPASELKKDLEAIAPVTVVASEAKPETKPATK